MGIIGELNEDAFEEWLDGRPDIIREVATKCPPGRLYLLKISNHRVFPYSYSEDGTITVVVSGEYNAVLFERKVFGIHPNDLVECDLPKKGEALGVLLSDDKLIDAYLSYIGSG